MASHLAESANAKAVDRIRVRRAGQDAASSPMQKQARDCRS